MTVIEVTKWRNVTRHWQNVFDGKKLLSRKGRMQWSASVWGEGGSHVLTCWSGACMSAWTCARTTAPPCSTGRRAREVVDRSVVDKYLQGMYVYISPRKHIHTYTQTPEWAPTTVACATLVMQCPKQFVKSAIFCSKTQMLRFVSKTSVCNVCAVIILAYTGNCHVCAGL